MKRSSRILTSALACVFVSLIVLPVNASTVTATMANNKVNGDIVFVGSAFVGGWPLDSTPAGDIIDSSTEAYVDIYSTDLEGQQKRLTHVGPGKYAQAPAVSPDGRWIVYTQIELQKIAVGNWADLMLMRIDGSEQQPLLDGPTAEKSPAWSPDGKKIVFIDADLMALRVLDLKTRDVETVFRGASGLGEPAWSPDGRAIAFEMNGSIYVVSPSGKNLRRVNKKPHIATHHPDWSPDGRWIAFNRDRVSEPGPGGAPPDHLASDIWVVSRDGSVERNLTDSGGTTYEEAPTWSPDGRYISFIRGYGDKDNWSVWMMRADGTDQRETYRFPDLHAMSQQIYWPDWAPATP